MEKERQLRLIQHVYQQAKDVVTYVPQAPDDERNLMALAPMILNAGGLC